VRPKAKLLLRRAEAHRLQGLRELARKDLRLAEGTPRSRFTYDLGEVDL